MNTTTHQIGDGIHRFSTYFPELVPGGFTFNQFLVVDEESLLYHCGMRGIFPLVSEAVQTVIPLERLRWISFGHVEADECGAMNQWLAAAPRATVVHGETGVQVSIADMADRPPRTLGDGEVLELGRRRVRVLPTPHVPHAWESIAMFEETSRTLFCGDLFTHAGNGPAVTESDLVAPALEAEAMFKASALTRATAPTIRRLAELRPQVLAVMHGSSYRGDGEAALRSLADGYEALFEAS